MAARLAKAKALSLRRASLWDAMKLARHFSAGLFSLRPYGTGRIQSPILGLPDTTRSAGGALIEISIPVTGSNPVIAPAEILFQPAIQRDEQIAAAHLSDLQLRFSVSPVAPRDGHRRPGVSADNRFQRQFDSQVEMR